MIGHGLLVSKVLDILFFKTYVFLHMRYYTLSLTPHKSDMKQNEFDEAVKAAREVFPRRDRTSRITDTKSIFEKHLPQVVGLKKKIRGIRPTPSWLSSICRPTMRRWGFLLGPADLGGRCVDGIPCGEDMHCQRVEG